MVAASNAMAMNNVEQFIIGLLTAGGIGGLLWAAVIFMSPPVNTTLDYQTAVAAQLPDACQTPPGYTDEEWREHWSHHPDQFAECL